MSGELDHKPGAVPEGLKLKLVLEIDEMEAVVSKMIGQAQAGKRLLGCFFG
jgi:hypothetical protein